MIYEIGVCGLKVSRVLMRNRGNIRNSMDTVLFPLQAACRELDFAGGDTTS